MTSTNMTLRGLTGSKNWAEPYSGPTRMPPKSMKSIAPAGAVNSNVIDMAAWLQVFLRDGLLDSGKQLASKQSMKQLRTRRVHDVEGFGPGSDYALGWFVSKADGNDLVWCPGNADGYSSYVSFMPSLGIGVIALVNQQVNTLGEQIATEIYQHAMGLAPPAEDQEPRSGGHSVPSLDLPPAGASPAYPLDVPAPTLGTYEHSAYGEIQIAKAGKNKLSLSYGGKKYSLIVQPHGGFAFPMTVFGFSYQVPVIFQNDPVAGDALRIPFEPASGWLEFLKT
jgi:CubicO group peptidase (beta-lactamase class C family)